MTGNDNEDKSFLFESCDTGKVNEEVKLTGIVPFSNKR